MSDRYTVSEIAVMLAERADDLARDLFPAGRREGPEWRVGGLDGAPGKSMAIHLAGHKAGVWCDFASGQGGDALSLIAESQCGGDIKEAIAWAKDWLGIHPTGQSRDPRGARERRSPTPRPTPMNSGHERSAASKKAQARWLEARPLAAGDPVDRYLKGRGIHLRYLGKAPGVLRYHPGLYCAEIGGPAPCMVAAINGPDGSFAAIHRTWLQVHGDGAVTKGKLQNPKKTWGTLAGGTIRLWRGVSGKRWAEAPADDTLVLTEGIEDALTLAMAQPEWRIAATVSLGNMARVVPPPAVREIVIAADNDGGNEAAGKALRQAIVVFMERGCTVKLTFPGGGCKDFNERLLIGQRSPEKAASRTAIGMAI